MWKKYEEKVNTENINVSLKKVEKVEKKLIS